MKINIYILLFIISSFVIRIILLKTKNIHNISRIVSNCNITNVKKYSIYSDDEYNKYLNYISCKCSGIGYWGGFCLSKKNKYVGGNSAYDIALSNELAKLFKEKEVVDLGAGLGMYCPIISRMARKCDQYDGSVNIEEITHGKTKYLNLAQPIKFECSYDVAMSIEVAEHIPKIYEDVYVNNLIKCSKEAILITWSKIGQGGHFHVNNKNREDVISLFERKGLKYNSDIVDRLKNVTNIWWLKNNILYFNK